MPDTPTGRSVHQSAIVAAGGHRPPNRIRSLYRASIVAGSKGGHTVHSKPFARYLGGAWRLLLCALPEGGYLAIAGGIVTVGGGVRGYEAGSAKKAEYTRTRNMVA